jgi:hypothetical protein
LILTAAHLLPCPQAQLKEWRIQHKNPPKDESRNNSGGEFDDIALPPPLTRPDFDVASDPSRFLPLSSPPQSTTHVTDGIAEGVTDMGFTDAELVALGEENTPDVRSWRLSSQVFLDQEDNDAEAEAAMMAIEDRNPAETQAPSVDVGATHGPAPDVEDELDAVLDVDLDELAWLEKKASEESSLGGRQREDKAADVNTDDAVPRASGLEQPWEEEDIYE